MHTTNKTKKCKQLSREQRADLEIILFLMSVAANGTRSQHPSARPYSKPADAHYVKKNVLTELVARNRPHALNHEEIYMNLKEINSP